MEKKTVSKSIRLSEEVVTQVECLPGKNFTNKLQGVLEDYFIKLPALKKELVYYDECIRKRRQELGNLNEIQLHIRGATRESITIQHKLEEISKSLDTVIK